METKTETPEVEKKNIPLTVEQKFAIVLIQKKILRKQAQRDGLNAEIAKLEVELQATLGQVTADNKIDFENVFLSEDLDIVAKVK